MDTRHKGFAILGSLDAALSDALRERLAEMNLEIRPARCASDFISLAARPGGRIAVLGADGLLWTKGRPDGTGVPLVLIDPCASKDRAIRALRLGFRDYLEWPAEVAAICDAVIPHLGPEPLSASAASRQTPTILTRNRELLQRIEYARRIASHRCNALITGETGTGKELFAELIHGSGERAAGPLISLNCSALPEHLVEGELFGYERGAFTGANRTFPGRFALADNGTLFLDEIGELPLPIQAKLLRALETREVTPLGGIRARRVDLRIVAATNQPLDTLVAEKRFRADLFFRLNVAVIEIPPLRERIEDIPLLFRHFLHRHTPEWRNSVPAVDPSVIEPLMAYHWPGNVRELRNSVESALLVCQGPRLLPEHLPKPLRIARTKITTERARLLAALDETRWNKSEAATRLNWSRMTLYRKMHKHGIGLRDEPCADWALPALAEIQS